MEDKTVDKTFYYDIETLKNKKNEIKKVFFYRICGTGMGAAACLLKQAGFSVEGADSTFFPPMSHYLKSTGINCYSLKDDAKTLTPEFFKQFDLIVVGNVIPRAGEDAKKIEALGVPFCSFPAALGALVLCDQNVVGIAGTHGKTTTTYLAMQVFKKLGLDPGYLIGGVLDGAPSSYLGDGSFFFIESDEYDSAYFEKVSKFRMYTIDHLILTSLEYDHADIYDSVEEIKKEFRAIIPSVSKSILFNSDYPDAVDLMRTYRESAKSNYIYTYGMNDTSGPRIIEKQSESTRFELTLEDNLTHEFETSLVGEHNILNLSAIIFFAYRAGYSVKDIQAAISELSLVKRRQEVRGFYGESIVIDDFAHHPKAVKLTIDAMRSKYPNKKINVVLEAHSATARSSIFQKEFEEALSQADSLIMTKIHRPTTARSARDLDINAIISAHHLRGKEGVVVSELDGLIKELDKFKQKSDVVLILSNGTCLGLWQSDFVDKLQK